MDGLREEIAAEAARLVVDGGMDYASAKLKAARNLGVRRGELPSHEAIEDAVREYLELFAADTQPLELQALREVAAQWMSRLAEFRPHLSGAVWRGTATRLSAVQIDLYCDEPKSAPLRLIDRGVEHDVGSLDDEDQTLVLTLSSPSATLREHVTVHLIVRDTDDLRGALKPDSRGRSWRGNLADLEALMDKERPR